MRGRARAVAGMTSCMRMIAPGWTSFSTVWEMAAVE